MLEWQVIKCKFNFKVRKWYKNSGLLKENYLGKTIPTAGGIFFIFTAIFLWSFPYFFYFQKNILYLDGFVFIIIIIASVGLIDDMAGGSEVRGFKGHFKYLLEGKITTGFLKSLVTFAAAVLYMLNIKQQGMTFAFFVNLLIFLLLTNFLNLLDTKPGRSLKFFIIFSFFIILKKPLFTFYLLPFLLTSVVYLPYELRNMIMLGDTGSNLLGAVLASLFILIDNNTVKLPVVIILLAVTVLSEFYSFSRIIEHNRILHWLDKLGRT